MTRERREHSRLVRPLDGKYSGASGGASCRIGDISWGGCFTQTLAQPAIGEKTIITLPVSGGVVEVPSTVIHCDHPMGFSVRFDPLSPKVMEGLRPLLGDPPADR
jgi:hypothetical protein